MSEKNQYLSIDRLAALINILSYDWEEATALIPQLDYPENDESAKRALRRDIAALVAFGFDIEKNDDYHHPAYRLVGHKKWPRAAAIERAMRPPETRNIRQG